MSTKKEEGANPQEEGTNPKEDATNQGNEGGEEEPSVKFNEIERALDNMEDYNPELVREARQVLDRQRSSPPQDPGKLDLNEEMEKTNWHPTDDEEN